MAKKFEEKDNSVSLQLEKFLDENKEDHYNFEPDVDYKVSTGSLNLDLALGGGVSPGIYRLCGLTEGGKTSAALLIGKNFQETVDDSLVVYNPAERKIKKTLLERSGVSTEKDKWFMYESNIYESVVSLCRELIFNNPTKKRYCIIIDSLDALQPKGDLEKKSGDAMKVSGAAVLLKDMLRRLSYPIGKFGHILIVMSQVSATIKINPYEKTDPKIVNGSGGNAVLHFPDVILEFQQRFKKDMILGGEQIVGHQCKLIIKKSTNEKSNTEVIYPIKYGRTAGKSVWVEYELVSQMMMYGDLKKGDKGSWLEFGEDLRKDLKKSGFDNVPEKVQGEDKAKLFLEENPALTAYLFNKYRSIIAGL